MLDEISSITSPIEIKTNSQKYFKPFTLADALLLRKTYPCATIIGGATDSALRQTKKQEFLPEILDISGIEELDYFIEDETVYKIGSGTNLEKLKSLIVEKLPALHKMLKVFGSLQIRNLATFGGNIASASPIGDMLPLLFAYKAKIKLQSADNERIVPIGDFIKGYRLTSIQNDELITEIEIPKPDSDTLICSYKVSKRKHLDISTVSGGFSLRLENETVKDIILAFGGMASQTKRATQTEEFLRGKAWTRKVVEEAMEILASEFLPLSDARSSAVYRSLIARNLLLKLFSETTTSGL
jgi:xanthine dehydrogenase small subunit